MSEVFNEYAKNQETAREFNQEPGIAIIPGSPYARHMEQFEQFPGKYGMSPGNAYVKKEYPKMLYRAERYKGVPACMAAPPDPIEFPNPGEFQRAEVMAQRFTEKCQLIVNDERERQKAMENGWRESPADAVEYLKARDKGESQADMERAYEDRNLSHAAKAEVAKVREERGGDPVPEMPEAPRRRGRRPAES